MAYATVQQFRSWFAGNGARVENYLKVEETQASSQITVALNAASARMDAGLKRNYAVPIDPTTATAGLRDELAAILAQRCIWFAMAELLPGLPSKADFMAQAESAAVNWLNSVIGIQGFRAYGDVGRLYSLSDLPGLTRVG